FQPRLPLEKLVLTGPGEGEELDVDILFVGAGPAGLSGAIELARLVARDNEAGGGLGEVSIGVLEKAESIGEHSLSGAVVNPRAFKELFPEVPDEELPLRGRVTGEQVLLLTESRSLRLPTPPTMH